MVMMTNELSASISIGKGVFFNPKMKALRSISAAFVKTNAKKGARLLDATSATGIRGIRYSLESGIKAPVLIDMNRAASSNTRRNISANGVDADVKSTSFQEFANTCGERFDVIDIDPFGSPAPLVYDALKIAKDGSLLMITATDTAVLYGAHANACLKVYGAVPLHTELCKEAGARILLAYMARNASQFNFGIEPLMCVSDMHYLRVFVRLAHGAAAALSSVKNLGIAGQCLSCRAFYYGNWISPVSDRCKRCGSAVQLSGQMWLKNITDRVAVAKTLNAFPGIKDKEAELQVKAISEELDIPFFYSLPRLTKALSIGSVSPKKVMERIERKGKKVSCTQFWKDSFKTDADYSEVAAAIMHYKHRK